MQWPARMRPATAVQPFVLLLALAALALPSGGCAGSVVEPIPPAVVPADRGARTTQFVTDFMAARARGDEAAAGLFLSPTAAEQLGAGAGGLALAGGGEGFAGWALLAAEAADANSYEVRVRVEPHAGTAWEELLFVGVGPGPDGESRDLTVRGVERLAPPAG
jgi:hypothetical protein